MNREDWLNAAKDILLSDYLLPENVVKIEPRVRISIGYPKGQRKVKALAQVMDSKLSTDGTAEIFVSPESNDGPAILASLTVALTRAAMGLYTGLPDMLTYALSKAEFSRDRTSAKADYVPSEDAQDMLESLAAELGPIPHAPIQASQKKQSTRLIKVECLDCEAVWRMSAKWTAVAYRCPCCATESIKIHN